MLTNLELSNHLCSCLQCTARPRSYDPPYTHVVAQVSSRDHIQTGTRHLHCRCRLKASGPTSVLRCIAAVYKTTEQKWTPFLGHNLHTESWGQSPRRTVLRCSQCTQLKHSPLEICQRRRRCKSSAQGSFGKTRADIPDTATGCPGRYGGLRKCLCSRMDRYG